MYIKLILVSRNLNFKSLKSRVVIENFRTYRCFKSILLQENLHRLLNKQVIGEMTNNSTLKKSK